MDPGSQRANSAQGRSSSHPAPKRSVSKASLKVQAQIEHNEAMSNRYFSGVDSKEHLPAYDDTATSWSAAGRMEDAMELKENKGAVWSESHALTTQGQRAVFATVDRQDEDAFPQRVHEIV